MSDAAKDPIAILAFDHRGEFSRSVLGVDVDELDHERRAALRDAKALIFEGYEVAARHGLRGLRSGVLVDEEFGGAVADRCCERRDFVFAMPVEKADRDIFEFEFGDAFAAHLERFQPDFAKALVRYNPDDDAEGRAIQLARLRSLSDWLQGSRTRFMFELIVRPTRWQLDHAASDRVLYEDQVRPALVRRAMRDIHEAGIRVDVWKLEGISLAAEAQAIAEEARSVDREVECVVLGAAAPEERVDQWLRVAAETEGFNGFAIGRNIWREVIRGYLSGVLDREDAVVSIARAYARFAERYVSYAR
ncbi:2-deoxy-5-keto-D-gluconate 6-phosphate aldolase domain-containing protein [Naasia sp. SYSU D00948]|uniref:2-deoxy-5-keto-D-gluconate 6-phosphate aldolase domain-containing protein n=1 Tax=Naasia sp. SYSU D00948 TaxID=2817379 RepID=UPI001B30B7EE|nr:DUF2090 domain-containing protein [Naasia sp. SYSU D00948]